MTKMELLMTCIAYQLKGLSTFWDQSPPCTVFQREQIPPHILFLLDRLPGDPEDPTMEEFRNMFPIT